MNNPILLKNSLNDIELSKLFYAGEVLSKLHKSIGSRINDFITSMDIEEYANSFLNKYQDIIPAFKGVYGYQFTTTVSVNNVILHGVPSKSLRFKPGDIIKVDAGTKCSGIIADAARAYVYKELECNYVAKVLKICNASKHVFDKVFLKIHENIETVEISRYMGKMIKEMGYYPCNEYVSHGVGKKLHLPPDIPTSVVDGIPNYKIGDRYPFTIEPLIMTKDEYVEIGSDKFSVELSKNVLTSHYEDTIVMINGAVRNITSLND